MTIREVASTSIATSACLPDPASGANGRVEARTEILVQLEPEWGEQLPRRVGAASLEPDHDVAGGGSAAQCLDDCPREIVAARGLEIGVDEGYRRVQLAHGRE